MVVMPAAVPMVVPMAVMIVVVVIVGVGHRAYVSPSRREGNPGD